MTSDVSVIIPVFNQAAFVRQAIDSALRQTLAPCEVIVVNDGSTDETAAVLDQYKDDPRVRVITQSNQGVATARNEGAAAATGSLLAFLDADDEWLPQKLELQSARFADEPGLGLVHCGVVEIDAAGTPLRERIDGRSGQVARDLLIFKGPVILGGGSGAMFPAEVFRAVGGFDRRLSTSADWDLFYRVAAAYPVRFVPEVLVKYRIHGSNMHGNIAAMRHDMLLGFQKAFAAAGPDAVAQRRYCYGRLHLVLAGSFLTIGQRRECLKHALISVWYRPSNLAELLRRVR
jgi:glycosyltransferase involved in cell wall biosynthesis